MAFFKKEVTTVHFSKEEYEAIIRDAKEIYEKLDTITKNTDYCRSKGVFSFMNTRFWLHLFKKIAQCNAAHNPFDSLDGIYLTNLCSKPSFKSDFIEEHRPKAIKIIEDINLFRQKYATPYQLSLNLMLINDSIKNKVFEIKQFITPMLTPTFSSEIEIVCLPGREQLGQITFLLEKLQENYPYIGCDTPNLPNPFIEFDALFSAIADYLGVVSTNDGLNDKTTLLIEQLKEQIEHLKSGIILNQEQWIAHTLAHISKFCQSELINGPFELITEGASLSSM